MGDIINIIISGGHTGSGTNISVTTQSSGEGPGQISGNFGGFGVSSVNGQVGDVVIDKSGIGLGNVEDLSIIQMSGDLNSYFSGEINNLSGSIQDNYQLITGLSALVFDQFDDQLNTILNLSGNIFEDLNDLNSGFFAEISRIDLDVSGIDLEILDIFQKLSNTSGNLNSLSGDLNSLSNNFNSFLNNFETYSGDVSGSIQNIFDELQSVSGSLNTLSSGIYNNSLEISGNFSGLLGLIQDLSGNFNNLSGTINNQSGYFENKFENSYEVIENNKKISLAMSVAL